MDTEGFDREEEVACTWKVEISKAQFLSDGGACKAIFDLLI